VTLGGAIAPTYGNRRVYVDVPFTTDLSAGWLNTDGSAFTIDDLPTGLTMSTAGVVSGTPTELDEEVTSRVTHRGVTSGPFTWTVTVKPPSGTLVDAKWEALRDQGFTGAMSDMTLQWLQANGATSDRISDAWLEMLTDKGAAGSQRSDMWYDLLGQMGYEGALPDREFLFWINGGVLP
jgi:hypothetical protein